MPPALQPPTLHVPDAPAENIYAVIAGSKTFTLLPPADIFRMALRQYPSATYRPAGTASTAAADDAVDAAVARGALPLHPVPDASGDRVLWTSLPPGPDAAAAAARGEGAAPAGPAWAPGMDLFNDPQLPPPIRVTVKAGEALYLPAMWWHQVRRACGPAMAGGARPQPAQGRLPSPLPSWLPMVLPPPTPARSPTLQVEQEPDEAGRAIAVNYWWAAAGVWVAAGSCSWLLILQCIHTSALHSPSQIHPPICHLLLHAISGTT